MSRYQTTSLETTHRKERGLATRTRENPFWTYRSLRGSQRSVVSGGLRRVSGGIAPGFENRGFWNLSLCNFCNFDRIVSYDVAFKAHDRDVYLEVLLLQIGPKLQKLGAKDFDFGGAQSDPKGRSVVGGQPPPSPRPGPRRVATFGSKTFDQ